MTTAWILVSIGCALFLGYRWARWSYGKGVETGLAAGQVHGSALSIITTTYLTVRKVVETEELDDGEKSRVLAVLYEMMIDAASAKAWLSEHPETSDQTDYIAEALEGKP